MAEIRSKVASVPSGRDVSTAPVNGDPTPPSEERAVADGTESSYHHVERPTPPPVKSGVSLTSSAARFRDEVLPRDWVPLEQVPKDVRELVRVARNHTNLIRDSRSKGGLPANGYKTARGWESGRLQKSPLRDFLVDGTIRDSQRNPPHKFWPDLRYKLFRVGIDENGKRIRVDEPVWLINLIRPVIEKEQGWKPIDKVPEHVRGLVGLARERAIELYGGRVPRQRIKTVDGWERNQLQFDYIHNFLVDGTLGDSPHRFWPDMRQILFEIDMNEYGDWVRVKEPDDLMDLIKPIIEKEEGWLPIVQVPKEVSELVRLVRDRAISLFGGRLPNQGFKVDGRTRGSLQKSPFRQLLIDGTIKYSNRTSPSVYWRKCAELFFGLERLSAGKYRRTKILKEHVTMLAHMQRQGERVWRDAMGNGSRSFVVYHPGTEPSASPELPAGSFTGIDGTFASCDPVHDPLMVGAMGVSTPLPMIGPLISMMGIGMPVC
ncbi:MAG: hypothetical protein ABH871_07910 [Pseudomonadota bacterium]